MIISKFSELHEHIEKILNNIDSRQITTFFRDHEKKYAHIFTGFRISANTIKNPIVRHRIINEANSDEMLFDFLCLQYLYDNEALVEAVTFGTLDSIKLQIPELVSEYGMLAVKIAFLADDRKGINNLAKKLKGDLLPAIEEKPAEFAETDKTEILKDETIDLVTEKIEEVKKKTKEKIQEYTNQIAELNKEKQRLSSSASKKDSIINSLQAQSNEIKKQLSKSQKSYRQQERIIGSLKNENSELKSKVKLLEREAKKIKLECQNMNKKVNQNDKKESLEWQNIIKDMINNNKLTEAAAFCEALCNVENNKQAHMLLCVIYNMNGDKINNAKHFMELSKLYLDENKYLMAFSHAANALELQPYDSKANDIFKQVIGKIDVSDENMVNKISSRLTKMKLNNPMAYKQIRKTIKQMGIQYSNSLINNIKHLHADKIITISDGSISKQMSVRSIIESINSNNVETVSFIIKALKWMRNKDSDIYCSIKKTIASINEVYIEVLDGSHDYIIVDGSNVAWHGDRKPHLRNIYAIRDYLWELGYFPIYIYVDAALIHQIDRVQDLQRMIDLGEVLPADGATSADTLIIEKAGIFKCPVITNDQMKEWDPENKIEKYHFDINDELEVNIYM